MTDSDIQSAPGIGPYEFTADQEKAMRQSSAANAGRQVGGSVQSLWRNPATGKETLGPKEPLMVEPISPDQF